MTAAARFYARLEPLAYDDDGTLENLTTAVMAPVEVGEIARDDDTHIAWSKLRDPDECPAILLDWLAVDQGVVFPPSAITEADKRYRIKQAAGRYRGTPRAIIEELQLVLTGTKTVYLAYFAADEWNFAVATIASESADSLAIERAIGAQRPAGMAHHWTTTGTWSNFVLAPTLIGTVDGDGNYVIGAPEYPTCQDVLDSFATCQDLLDNNPI